MPFCHLLILFKIDFFFLFFFGGGGAESDHHRISPSDHARCFVRPDMGSNCLQRLSADDTSRERLSSLHDEDFTCLFVIS